jgi:hypothetical protein
MKTKLPTARTAFLAIAIGIVFAAFAQDHSGPPGQSPEEECIRQCHVNECNDYVACIGTADPTMCRRNAANKEIECMKKCEPPRG